MVDAKSPDVKPKAKMPSKNTKTIPSSKALGKQVMGRYNPAVDSDTEEIIDVAQPTGTEPNASASKIRSSNNDNGEPLAPVTDGEDVSAEHSDGSAKADSSIFPIKPKICVKKGKAAAKKDDTTPAPEVEPKLMHSSSAYVHDRPTWSTTRQALNFPVVGPNSTHSPFVSRCFQPRIVPKKIEGPTDPAIKPSKSTQYPSSPQTVADTLPKKTTAPPAPEVKYSSIENPIPTKIRPSDPRHNRFLGPVNQIVSRDRGTTDEDTAMTDFDGPVPRRSDTRNPYGYPDPSRSVPVDEEGNPTSYYSRLDGGTQTLKFVEQEGSDGNPSGLRAEMTEVERVKPTATYACKSDKRCKKKDCPKHGKK
ncbi:hypothetical protein AUEXF2481DRAFT_505412 [Aureobasidium subglaciale EXF-2481]|uniref:Uncharacterized protein n=1 Tax=Aureobasidium subglaciale (strain EXF-2481) TaxID=1043005 RepID=A0A074Y0J5_AURSE|nr:uncharacterized protein AUEXF2481DRAFT_505412 [Aureobasidium subglaciale EXF-2481]KAI5198556.1 hypothetical protein E4T38_07477 [Aureobasidium subglaciale]KAI5217333.1 hypothetical protein E4T40_07488 [Aureobasidium subglaciale]KAI5220900.1 hypothetical protein E4T41_07329 [Aureobasidium subglaciale]KAI5258516.1 hypothetical protein E4T46_07306 [Aureobasidium subglaciale]KEQ91245.1 hypothetical protein AUEXF2481DRAFT_505412 [Aureobasidium subglaciale EXF-2481]